MSKKLKTLSSTELSRKVEEKISLNDDNLIEESFKKKLRQVQAMEIYNYINNEDRYEFDSKAAYKCMCDDIKKEDIDSSLIIKKIGKFNPQEDINVREFLQESTKNYVLIEGKDEEGNIIRIPDKVTIESVLFEKLKKWIEANKQNLIDEYILIGKEKLLDCIYKMLVRTEISIEETKEDLETGEVIKEVVNQKSADYIEVKDSEYIKGLSVKELVEIILEEVIGSPFTYLYLYDELELKDLYARGYELVNMK